MTTHPQRPRPPQRRTLAFPHHHILYGARLEALREERRRDQPEIMLEFSELRLTSEPEPCLVAGRPAERVRGEYVPRRLRFPNGRVTLHGVLTQLDALPPRDSARTLFGWGYARSAGSNIYHFASDTEDYGELRLEAGPAILEPREGLITPVELTRHWSPAPLERPRIIPHPTRLHQRYAGDPITIQLGGRAHRTRFFIGGIRHQDAQGCRPDVDAVLNLCHLPNIWLMDGTSAASDRWTCKGEGRACMAPAELLAEAEWVAERLRAGRRVLVHCYAGMNRSATICCAALILLEGLSAEQALSRVREHHPEAWPDPYYWLLLRWLAGSAGSQEQRLAPLREPARRTPTGTSLAR